MHAHGLPSTTGTGCMHRVKGKAAPSGQGLACQVAVPVTSYYGRALTQEHFEGSSRPNRDLARRAEACGAMQLASAGHASPSQRHAFMLRAAATNQDGRSSALTAPNGRAQQTVIRAALELASVLPLAVSLVQVSKTCATAP